MKKFLKVVLSLSVISLVLVSLSACEEKKLATSLLKNPNNPVVRMQTNVGDIFIELYEKEAPISVENFLSYIEDDFYTDTIFHRVINDFMIQGGGFEKGLKQKKAKKPIKNEATNGLSNKRGTIAMARTNIVDSATCQFFINVKDNAFLDHSPRNFGYAVFGKVVDGMDTVDKIKGKKTANYGRFQNVPVKDITIKKISVIKK